MTDPLAAGFDPVSLEQWTEAATKGEKEIQLHTVLEDGIEAKWLYTPEDTLGPDPAGLPGAAPFVRGARAGRHWQIRQEHTNPELAAANREILEDLNGGVTEITLRFDRAARLGIDPSDSAFEASRGLDGVAIRGLDDLSLVLEGVYLDLAGVALDAGAGAVAAAGLLTSLWRENGIAPGAALGSFRVDPLGTLARHGSLTLPPEDALAEAGSLAAATSRDWPGVRSLAVDTNIYVEAGASTAWELGLAVATGVEYLRAGLAAGVEPSDLAAQLEFTLAVGPDQFLEMAKFRAIRRLWARVLEECGVEPDGRRSATYGRTTARMITAVDPWVNMLRVTTAAFAAGTGGADGVTVTPFDRALGQPGGLGRRIARNTQILLQDEASLGRIADPLAGSWYGEKLTDELARTGWEKFTEIEREGGVLAALRSGSIASTMAALADRREEELVHRKRIMTGINEFPLLGEDGTAAARSDVAAGKAEANVSLPGPDRPGEVTPLAVRPDEAPIRRLREAAREREAAGGERPRIFLACMGSIAAHVNYANWAKSFFEVAGIETVQSGALAGNAEQVDAFTAGGFSVAAICAGKNESPEDVAGLVAGLREAGAEYIYMVNSTPELNQAAADAGADELVRNGVNMSEVLGAALGRLDVEVAR